MKQMLPVLAVIISALASACYSEFQVNSYRAEHQRDADIAMDEAGNFVVVWDSYRQDGSSGGIFGQRYCADGTAIGAEFQANAVSIGNQKAPSAAMDAAGNFVVVWHGPGIEQEDIFARCFDASGVALGEEFRVNNHTRSRQMYPSVAMSDDGMFAVVWESEKSMSGPEVRMIAGRVYDCVAVPITGEFDVNALTNCRYPDVAMDTEGNFAVAWMQERISNVIVTRVYDASGNGKTSIFQVSTRSFCTITRPSIGMGLRGHFVVAWDETPLLGGVDDVYARRYRFDGTAMCEPFVVNTTRGGTGQRPSVAMNNRREFVIVWNRATDVNENDKDIFGQRYDSLWQPIGDEFAVNSYVAGDQRYPVVAMRDDGEFVMAWQSDGQDGSEYGIFAEFGPKIGCAELSGDNLVNFRDYCVLAEEWLREQNPLGADLVDDNKVDEEDFAAFSGQWLREQYQCNQVDINGDGKIDLRDYAFLAQGWLVKGPNAGSDITANGIVDIADLKILVFYWAKDCE